MQRHAYLTPITAGDDGTGVMEYRPYFPPGFYASYSAIIVSNGQGHPVKSHALAAVDAVDHGPLLNDPLIVPLPDIPPEWSDATVFALHEEFELGDYSGELIGG